MKYNLIFYLSKKTSYCEKAIRKALNTVGGEPHRIAAAVEPTALGEEVIRSLKACPLTVIIGGFNSDEDDNIETVLSRVFSKSPLTLENMRKLSVPGGREGYIIRCKTQILLALPDSPEDITQMCSEELLAFISEKLNPESEEAVTP